MDIKQIAGQHKNKQTSVIYTGYNHYMIKINWYILIGSVKSLIPVKTIHLATHHPATHPPSPNFSDIKITALTVNHF